MKESMNEIQKPALPEGYELTEDRWRVVLLRSATCCRVWRVKHLIGDPIVYGPYRRLKYAKKRATEFRKSRVKTIEADDSIKDWGPSYRKVTVEKIGGR